MPIAATAVVKRAEQAATGTSESAGGRAAAGTSAALDAPEAQALAVLLSRRDALPRQAQPQDEDGWGTGPAKTAAAALADVLRAHSTGAYARVLTAGQVSAGLTPQTAQAVVAALTARPVVAAHGKRRGLGPGLKGVASR
ncbi:hypothetical protein [Streptomyces nitrosporeus]|uniref:hypothetical protein n=1 Tax=Streptomyces nitrosporeus TaxID=28894 RepID=UPI00167D306D|nr:hypothetical protein [Streptomyces nitrosporeus]GGZ18279.1 hypothetical protein GCM10010327_56700 [Streptomyces nitrosporeus]